MLAFIRKYSKGESVGHNPRPALHHPTLETVLVTAVLHALSDETRLSIVRTLHAEPDGRACGTFPVNVAPSTLSHHFKVLREAGLIRQEDRGTQRWTMLRVREVDARFPGFLDAVIAATEVASVRF
ncbi:transcriptional regulator [Cryobacterium melibiosiphilum]|uniref:Transcriptional regulator n=1 Tax=Cryobacterium melibiosiphilum TaxID=995039 RepID=A0A3A5MM05_9MICO|nr:helix-turn-helix domain-containing protein [Cryobacterium melibiosiphilum]RJT90035.1 transcriptional regulator [Cryobacterium melibiosiphilum]